MPAFGDLMVVVVVAFAAPFALGFVPRLRLPSVVLEIVAGIVVGPSVLGLVEVDQAIEVLALIGLAFLLFLAGLEIDFGRLRGQVLRLMALGFALSFLAAGAVGLRLKLEAMGFGFFIPVFFVTSGVRFDLGALTAEVSSLAMVPVFLAALLVVRGLPALVYRHVLDARRTAVAAILQATSLPFIVAAAAIGMGLGMIGAAESAA